MADDVRVVGKQPGNTTTAVAQPSGSNTEAVEEPSGSNTKAVEQQPSDNAKAVNDEAEDLIEYDENVEGRDDLGLDLSNGQAHIEEGPSGLGEMPFNEADDDDTRSAFDDSPTFHDADETPDAITDAAQVPLPASPDTDNLSFPSDDEHARGCARGCRCASCIPLALRTRKPEDPPQ